MKNIRFFLCSCMLLISWISPGYSAYLDLSWNPNGEADLEGYRVYYGTSSGTYGSPIDVGNVIAYRLTGLNDGVRYYISLTAYDTSNNESAKSTEISGIPPDTQIPTITITSPTSASTFTTTGQTITVAGSATDNLDVTQVTWINNRGGSGTAVGTDSFSAAAYKPVRGQQHYYGYSTRCCAQFRNRQHNHHLHSSNHFQLQQHQHHNFHRNNHDPIHHHDHRSDHDYNASAFHLNLNRSAHYHNHCTDHNHNDAHYHDAAVFHLNLNRSTHYHNHCTDHDHNDAHYHDAAAFQLNLFNHSNNYHDQH